MNLRKFLFINFAIICMSFSNSVGLSQEERKYALNLLEETQKDLFKEVSGLTTEQLKFKPDTATWSIAECVEHIAKSESDIFELVQNALKQPGDPSKRNEVKITDEALVQMIADRSTKRKTRDVLEPTGMFGTYESTLAAFKSRRMHSIEYIKATSDDLRSHYVDFPFGKADAYQTVLLMAAHTRRHTNQIREIIKHMNFPKKKSSK